MVVAVHEQCWVNTYRQLLYNWKQFHECNHGNRAQYFCTRYVDNRLLIVPARLLQLHPFQQLIHPDFYMKPVELEHEPGPGLDLLGFELDPSQFAIRYTTPDNYNSTTFPHHTPPQPPPYSTAALNTLQLVTTEKFNTVDPEVLSTPDDESS